MAHVAFAARFSRAQPAHVRASDRTLNIVAAVCIVAGATLFLLARRTLASIAAGGISVAAESPITNVAFTDSVVLRSRVGMWLVGVGAILSVASAISHRFRRSA